MKILFGLLALIIVTKECDSNELKSENNASSKTALQDTVSNITYTTQSRGSFEEISISKEGVAISKSNDSNAKTIYKIGEKDWQELMALVSEVPLEKLSRLEAPTDKRLYDGAAMANLKLSKDGKIVETPTFDHGYPPKAIENLVNKVLSVRDDALRE